MKTFLAVFIFTILSVCLAGVLNQDFSTTDEQGGYHFGFNDGHQARQEERSAEGVVRGAYSYIDANGETQTITYTADKHNGFLASGTSIPKVPEAGEQLAIIPEAAVVEDTPEVKAARAEHLEAHKKALIGEVASAPIVYNQVPFAVQYTPEVSAARAQHFYATNQQLLGRSGYFTYSNQPAVKYIIQGSQHHPDYLPYAAYYGN